MQSHQAVLLAVATVSDITANREAYQQLPILNFEGGVTYSDKVPAPPDLVERFLQPSSSGSAAAIMAFEAGGANSMEPLAVAASLGLPCVDVDGMGRAYPELQVSFPVHTLGPYHSLCLSRCTPRSYTVSLGTHSSKQTSLVG